MRGKFRCINCGKIYHEPLTHIYEYEEINHFHTLYPMTEIKFCLDCKSFVCVQKGIYVSKVLEEAKEAKQAKPDKAKHLYKLLDYLNGRNTKDACVECGGQNLVDRYTCFCPECGIGFFEYIKPEESDIRIRYGKKIIKPVFEEAKVNRTKGHVQNIDKKEVIEKQVQEKSSKKDERKWLKIIIKNVVIGFIIVLLSDMLREISVDRPIKYTVLSSLLIAVVYPFFKIIVHGLFDYVADIIKINTKGKEGMLSMLSHIVAIVLIALFLGNSLTESSGYDYEYYEDGPNSRVEQFLGL